VALKIGLIGMIGEALEDDFWGTLRRVADMGYEGIEGSAGLAERAGLPIPEMRQKLEAMGLLPVAQGGIKLGMGDDELRQAIATARAAGCKYIVQYWAACEDEQALLRDAEFYNEAGRMCHEEGLFLCYHNHDHEFKTFNGKHGLEILLDNTNPEYFGAELDVAWTTFGGADPVAIIRKYAGRCPVLHMKDFARLEPGCETASGNRKAAQFTEVGTGIVDTEGVVEAARTCGVEWLVVEQDRARDLPRMESAKVSCENLKALVG